jgi:glycerophosphoryl diester phosphodiesterase
VLHSAQQAHSDTPDQGFWHIETDCQLSADGVPVIIHGEQLHRTTDGAGEPGAARGADLKGSAAAEWQGVLGVARVHLSRLGAWCAGAVSSFSAAELRRLDAGSWFAAEYAGQRIPLLTEVLALLAEAHLHLVSSLPQAEHGLVRCGGHHMRGPRSAGCLLRHPEPTAGRQASHTWKGQFQMR